MKLITQRLVLRDVERRDIGNLAKQANNLNVSRFLLAVPYPYTKSVAQKFIGHCIKEAKKKPRVKYEFGITLREEDRVIGMIGLTGIKKFEGTATIGYWLGEDYWRNGYMTEALERVINFAFDRLRLRRIDISAFVENESSIGLIEKMGFNYEGTRIKNHRAKSTGEYHDEKIYGLLRKDWKGS